jgi:phosphoglycolate phosphatase-like HAD superfamily hydrolase
LARSETCVIFDIDGTLLNSTVVDDQLYTTAVRDVLGNVHIRPSWGDYEHVTDTGILNAICRENGLEPREHAVQVRERFGQLMSTHLSRTGGFAPIPGAVQFFDQLRSRPGVHVGIATGGWGHTARMKLRHAGFDISSIPLTCSDDYHERAQIMMLCRSKLSARATQVVYIGDGQWDRQASERLGWDFIGIGDRLRGQCKHWLADLLQPWPAELGLPI